VADLVVERVCGLVVARGRCSRVWVDHRAVPPPRPGHAVASSSQYRVIELVLEHFDLARHFLFAHSAEDEAFASRTPRSSSPQRQSSVSSDGVPGVRGRPAGVLAAKRRACA